MVSVNVVYHNVIIITTLTPDNNFEKKNKSKSKYESDVDHEVDVVLAALVFIHDVNRLDNYSNSSNSSNYSCDNGDVNRKEATCEWHCFHSISDCFALF